MDGVKVKPDKPRIDPGRWTTEQAMDFLSIGRTHFYAMNSTGELGPEMIKSGKRTFWGKRELQAWVDYGCPVREEWRGIWRQLRGRAG